MHRPADWATASSPVAARQTSGRSMSTPASISEVLTIRTGASPRRVVRAASSTARRWRGHIRVLRWTAPGRGAIRSNRALAWRRLLTMQSIRGAAAKRRATVSSGVAPGMRSTATRRRVRASRGGSGASSRVSSIGSPAAKPSIRRKAGCVAVQSTTLAP
ncbi:MULTISPECIES: hypothetical protein [Methylobacterium]|uniref:hypothetical protein n=2 Tax=Methylobacterium TaxID=407 RepID=UPI00190E54C4|nr:MULTISPECIES: hypothetical protein [Methylobacterium]MBZ6414166.1 hypothetical protein [Methylobacterium sp.]